MRRAAQKGVAYDPEAVKPAQAACGLLSKTRDGAQSDQPLHQIMSLKINLT
jgi:hypothetical protein